MTSIHALCGGMIELDPAEMSRSLGALRDWRDRKGATVIYGHDAAQWQTLHRAPRPLI